MPDAKETEQQGLAEEGTYEVTGTHEVLGHAPGSVFTATLPEEQKRILLESGALKESKKQPNEVEAAPTPAALAAELGVTPATAEEAAALQPSDPSALTDDTDEQ